MGRGKKIKDERGTMFGFLTFSSSTKLYRGRVPRMKSDNFMCRHTETGRGDHEFHLSRSHYTDIDQ